ncbi:MAG: phosphotriesterase family protein [Rubrobacter sp.]
MSTLTTTLGPKSKDELGVILPHEHVFVDLRTPGTPGYAEADPEDVVRLMVPEIERARKAGVAAIVEPSTVGVGRRADILKLVSETADFPLVVPTGVYREPWVPDWVERVDEAELREWMAGELAGEIGSSGVRAGWIKVSAGDDGITETETKILRAAARAAEGAAIGSHTIRGRVVGDQLDIIERAGYSPERFVWIHAHLEPDFDLNLEMARRGAWIEYDGIGDGNDDAYVERILRVLDAGLGDRLLLSQDRGWYDPAKPGGGTPNPYTHLFENFLPKLRSAGVDEETVYGLISANPFEAFAL